MKKTSKILAFALSAVLISCSIQSSAYAYGYIKDNPTGNWGRVLEYIVPDGYKELEHDDKTVTLIEKSEISIDGEFKYLIYNSFQFNDLTLEFNESVPFDWEAIYEKYLADIEFDHTDDPSDSYCVHLYDLPKGDDPRNADGITYKYKEVSEACAKMYEDGILNSATFLPVDIYYNNSYGLPAVFIKTDLPEDEVKEIASKYADINMFKTVDVISNKYYFACFNNIENIESLIDIRNNLRAEGIFEDVTQSVITYESQNNQLASESINLLDPYICDIDGNGEANISDATLVLDDYAQRMAGVRVASNENMDANGDGEVNIDDAAYILTYYAEASAGLR